MAPPGRFQERPALVDAGDAILEGFYQRGSGARAVLLCPALDAAGMEAAPVVEIAWAAARAGLATLRFQYRGRGASQGVPDPDRAVDDAAAALLHLEESSGVRAVPAGLGDGCAVAVALAARRPGGRALLVAPPRVPGIPPGLVARVLLPGEGSAVDPAEVAAVVEPAGGVVEVVDGVDLRLARALPALARRAAAWLAAA